MSATKSAGRSRAVEQPQERDLRVRGRDDRRRVDLLAGLEHDAGDRAADGRDLRDRRRRSGSRAPNDRAAERERLRHAAHAAAREAPGADLAVADVADVVVQP